MKGHQLLVAPIDCILGSPSIYVDNPSEIRSEFSFFRERGISVFQGSSVGKFRTNGVGRSGANMHALGHSPPEKENVTTARSENEKPRKLYSRLPLNPYPSVTDLSYGL